MPRLCCRFQPPCLSTTRLRDFSLSAWTRLAYSCGVSPSDRRTEEEQLEASGRVWWAAAIVTVINAFTSAGFSVAGVIATLPSSNPSARVFAMYAAARSLPLAAAVLWLVRVRSTRTLGTLAFVMAVIQACDAVVGFAQHELGKTLGPAVFSVATFAGALALFRGARHMPHRW